MSLTCEVPIASASVFALAFSLSLIAFVAKSIFASRSLLGSEVTIIVGSFDLLGSLFPDASLKLIGSTPSLSIIALTMSCLSLLLAGDPSLLKAKESKNSLSFLVNELRENRCPLRSFSLSAWKRVLRKSGERSGVFAVSCDKSIGLSFVKVSFRYLTKSGRPSVLTASSVSNFRAGPRPCVPGSGIHPPACPAIYVPSSCRRAITGYVPPSRNGISRV